MTRENNHLRQAVDALIAATNAFDVERVLALFASDAVIDDPSTGHIFNGQEGVSDYIERYFIGYHTVTRVLSVEILGGNLVRVQVDFTGDFGHEIGLLEISVNTDGLIAHIDANLE